MFIFFSQKSQELHRICILKLGSSETVVVVIGSVYCVYDDFVCKETVDTYRCS